MARCFLFTIFCLSFLAGCGDGRPETAVVCGVVTYGGKPVEGASVMFLPEGRRAASGDTDAQGRFELMTFLPGDGAVVGKHRVTISKKVGAPDPKAPDSPYKIYRDVLPKRYADMQQSGFTTNVELGRTNEFTFDLID